MPFKVGVPVQFPDFVDRKDELKSLLHFIEDGQNVMIHAPRRYGKTSLISEAYRQYKGDTLYFDLKRYDDLSILAKDLIEQIYQIMGISSFWENVKLSIAKFLKSLRAKVGLKLFELVEISIEKIEYLENTNKKDEIFLYALELCENLALNSKKHITIAFDEFQDLSFMLAKNQQILSKLRAVIQHHKHVNYIFCGSHQSLMNKIFMDKTSPFFHFCRIIELGSLDLDELFIYVKKQFSKIKATLDNTMLKEYLIKLDCHPYYSMKTM